MRNRFSIFLTVLLLVVGAAATALFRPELFQTARDWAGGLLPGGRPAPAQQAAPAAPPPPEVGVVEVRQAEVPVPLEYAGRVAGFREVEVRPQVGGLILKREFEEGARVKEDQVLFRIDPATYEVALARAEAQLAQAQAQATEAQANFARIQELETRAVSTERQLEQARAQRDLTRAAVQAAEAEINAAKLNISYTIVNAPVSGVTALTSPPEGTLVVAQQTVLTTITQLDPAFVNFSFTDLEYKRFRELNARRAQPITAQDLAVELHYGDGSVYPQPGRIDIAAQRVDPQTGTISARAIFPNAEGAILPGQFVRLVVRGVSLPDAIVIPERAISQTPQGPSVFVIEANNTAQVRPLRLGQQVADGFVVQDGLRPGERVVVDGLIRVRPGAPVRPAAAGAVPPGQQASPPQQQTGALQPGSASPTGGNSGAGAQR